MRTGLRVLRIFIGGMLNIGSPLICCRPATWCELDTPAGHVGCRLDYTAMTTTLAVSSKKPVFLRALINTLGQRGYVAGGERVTACGRGDCAAWGSNAGCRDKLHTDAVAVRARTVFPAQGGHLRGFVRPAVTSL